MGLAMSPLIPLAVAVLALGFAWDLGRRDKIKGDSHGGPDRAGDASSGGDDHPRKPDPGGSRSARRKGGVTNGADTSGRRASSDDARTSDTGDGSGGESGSEPPAPDPAGGVTQ